MDYLKNEWMWCEPKDETIFNGLSIGINGGYTYNASKSLEVGIIRKDFKKKERKRTLSSKRKIKILDKKKEKMFSTKKN